MNPSTVQKIRGALEHTLAVFTSMADRGNYPRELMLDSHAQDGKTLFLGKQGWEFLTNAISLLPPDSMSGYDRAVHALAPMLPDGWYCDTPDGGLMQFNAKPEIHEDGKICLSEGVDLVNDWEFNMPSCEDGIKASLRHIVSGEVQP